MAIVASIPFAGNAAEALDFYHGVFGGNAMKFPFSNTPDNQEISQDWQEKLAWGSLVSPFGNIHVMDPPPGRGGASSGDITLTVEHDDEAKAKELFDKIVAGGETYMPWGPTFYAKQVGMGVDKFGVQWLISVPLPQSVA